MEILQIAKHTLEIACKELNINYPVVVLGGNFITKTTLAYTTKTSEQFKVHLSEGLVNTYDVMFAVFHECRHIWQINENFSFLNYSNSINISKKRYNEQIEEIDAHAFASIMMQKHFSIKPLFEGFKNKTKKLIENRIDELKHNYL